MLSRFSLCGTANLARCLIRFQPISAITTSAASASETPAKKESSSPQNTKYPLELPPATSKRDYVNFPRPVVKERAPPVRFGFLPDSWFQAFYPKTGYTGPYMLLFGGTTYVLSKEILPYDHNATHLYSMILLLMIIHMKFGDKIGEIYLQWLKEEEELFDGVDRKERNSYKEVIADLKEFVGLREHVIEILRGRTEFIYLQMEMHFRQRLADAYKMIKSRLDCQAELESAEKRVAQRNLMDYVIRNVMKSITPELEGNILQMCISDLNTLAAKA